MSNTGTTGRIPLWLVGTVVGLAAIGLLAIFLRILRRIRVFPLIFTVFDVTNTINETFWCLSNVLV